MQERQGTRVPPLGQEDPLEEERASCLSILAWDIPSAVERGGLPSMGSQKSQTRLSTNTQARLQTDTLTPTRARGEDGGAGSWVSHTTEMSAALLVGKWPSHRCRQLLFLALNLPCMLPWWLRRQRICLQCRRPRFYAWAGEIPWRREWQPTPVFLPGEFRDSLYLV